MLFNILYKHRKTYNTHIYSYCLETCFSTYYTNTERHIIQTYTHIKLVDTLVYNGGIAMGKTVTKALRSARLARMSKCLYANGPGRTNLNDKKGIHRPFSLSRVLFIHIIILIIVIIIILIIIIILLLS